MATSRSRSRTPRAPIAPAAATAAANTPTGAGSPSMTAPAAPLNPTSARPCTAKDMLRIVTIGPTTPATTAVMTPASSACWTNA